MKTQTLKDNNIVSVIHNNLFVEYRIEVQIYIHKNTIKGFK